MILAVLTKLTLDEVNSLIKDSNICFNSIKETSLGISDTTYIGTSNDTKYIFKLYENCCVEDVKNQIKILDRLKNLNVPNVVSKELIFIIIDQSHFYLILKVILLKLYLKSI